MSLRRHQISWRGRWRQRLRRWILHWVDRWLPEQSPPLEMRGRQVRGIGSVREERLLGNRLRRKLRERHRSALLEK